MNLDNYLGRHWAVGLLGERKGAGAVDVAGGDMSVAVGGIYCPC